MLTRRPEMWVILALALPAAASCTGAIEEAAPETADPAAPSGRQAGAGGAGPNATPNPPAAPAGAPAPAARAACGSFQMGAGRLLRLTRSQYDSTVRDLLGDRSAPAQSFPVDDRDAGLAFWVNGATGV